MMEKDRATIEYYNANAGAFAASTNPSFVAPNS